MAEEDLEGLTTESAHARSRDLDLLPTAEMLRILNQEDARVAPAVGEVVPAIAGLVDRTAAALARGGRLHYFGAGTSGRIGILDAAECPPTFGIPASLVQGHMAGGPEALLEAVEGVEDDPLLGERDVREAGVRAGDVVVALSASGRTPYALGALRAARDLGALAAVITCNRNTPAHQLAEIAVAPVVGEEVLSGSTRLKAGTAQKLVLNMISTGVMIRSGRTYGGLMVGVLATNAKLRARARRLVRSITEREEGVDEALEASGWDVRVACLVLLRQLDPERAREHLQGCGSSLRRALEAPPA